MGFKDDIGNRMKTNYEEIPKIRLMRRTPVICRIDGRSFHTFTRGFKRPFDDVLIKSMQDTTKYLCENIMGCVFGYTQSDEISLLLIDYKKLESQAFFDYEIQKICSITASMATMAFNKFFNKRVADLQDPQEQSKYKTAITKGAMFDSRCFNIPKEEVMNYFYWRQLDATRNSILMVGQANFSHKELQNKSCNNIQDMLFDIFGINWNDFPITKKRGSSCIKIEDNVDGITRSKWIINDETPIFTGAKDMFESLVIY